MTKIERTCPRCGLVFNSEKIDSLCPACVLGSLLDSGENDSAGSAFWEDGDTAENTSRGFSHFEIIEEIGRGGMGVVYRARDRGTGRIVALKVLQAHHLDTPDLVQRFRAEVRAITSLDHPHVLPIHEVGEHEGIPFFSMKLTTGGSLAHRVGDYLGNPRKIAQILSKIARGVHHAHERGILHRDLKPGNILLDAAGEPYVCDFGLAKWIEDDQRLTVTAAVLGTPYYIAPEQAAGEKILTAAVDVYSLGAMLYELLTGRPPFVGQNVIETLRQASEKSPERPSSIVHNISRDLETICLKCLEREPGSRYATAAAMANDLDHWLEGRPIHARPVSAAEQLWRWGKRNPLPATLAVIIMVALVAVATISTVSAIRIKAAEKDAREQLYQSLVAQAHASRLTGRAGQRFDALEAIRKAAQIRPSVELRSEAIAALALYDMRIAKRWPVREYPLSQPLKFDEDLQHIYVATPSGDIQVLRTSDQSLIHTLPSSGNSLFALTHSGKKFLAGRGEKQSLNIWNLDERKLAKHFDDFPLVSRGQKWVYDFTFSPTENYFAASKSETEVIIFETKSWTRHATVSTSVEPQIIAFSPDGSCLAVASTVSPRLEIWNVESSKPVLLLAKELPAIPQHFDWSPDGRLLLLGSRDYNVYGLSTRDGSLKFTLSGHRQDVTQVTISHDGNLVASTARDRTIRLWDLRTNSELVVMSGLGAEGALRFSKNDQLLSATDYGQDAVLLDIAGRVRSVTTLSATESGDFATLVSSIDFSPSGKLIATASYLSVSLWDRVNQKFIQSFPINEKSLPIGEREKSVRFLNDDSTLLITSRASIPTIYKVQYAGAEPTINPIKTLNVGKGLMLGSKGHHNSDIACFISNVTGTALLYSLSQNSIVAALPEQKQIWDMVTPPSLGWAVTTYYGRDPGIARIWKLQPDKTPELVKELPTSDGDILTPSPDYRRLVTNGFKGALCWDTENWTKSALPAPTQNTANIYTVAYSSDGSLMAASDDDRIFVFNSNDHTKFFVLESKVGSSNNYRLQFSPDGLFLAAQGSDNSLRIWDMLTIDNELKSLHLSGIK